jgi:hypothetical protein
MTDHDFDQTLIAAAFAMAARAGWSEVSVAGAAREAGLTLERARARFVGRGAILIRFGRLADEHALTGALDTGPTREKLFDLVMRRLDALQQHRAGVLALLRDLPFEPATALMLAASTSSSMAWMLAAAGVKTTGLKGGLATQGMVAVWLYALRAWQKDDSADLSGTMAALDRALSRAEQAAGWLSGGPAAPEPKPFPAPPADLGTLGTISGAGDIPPADASPV